MSQSVDEYYATPKKKREKMERKERKQQKRKTLQAGKIFEEYITQLRKMRKNG